MEGAESSLSIQFAISSSPGAPIPQSHVALRLLGILRGEVFGLRFHLRKDTLATNKPVICLLSCI